MNSHVCGYDRLCMSYGYGWAGGVLFKCSIVSGVQYSTSRISLGDKLAVQYIDIMQPKHTRYTHIDIQQNTAAGQDTWWRLVAGGDRWCGWLGADTGGVWRRALNL